MRKNDTFAGYHPLISFLYYALVLLFSMCLMHPAYLLISLAGAAERGVFSRVRNAATVFSSMVTWSMENAIETADSMRARGYGLPGRTAFSIYRFDARDRAALAWIGFCGAYVVSGWIAGGTYFRYYPTVRAAAWTPMNVSFMLAYLALCMTPVMLNWKEARKWKSLRSAI